MLTGALANASQDTVPDTVIFGGDANYPPFERMHEGTPQQLTVELARAIAEAGDREAEHQLGDWPTAVRALDDGTVDVVPMFRTAERAERYHFSIPFYFAETAAFAPPGMPGITGVADLSGHRIAVERRSHAHRRLAEADRTMDLVLAEDTPSALQAVTEGRAGYAVVHDLVARRLIDSRNSELVQKGPSLWSHPYAFAVRKDREALAEWLDRAFHSVIVSGEFQQIYTNWEHRHKTAGEAVPWGTILQVAAGLAIPLILVAGAAVAWNRSLKQKVATRTSELEEELTRRKEAEKAVRRLAHYDPLTDLPRLQPYLEQVDAILKTRAGDRALEMIAIQIRNLADAARVLGGDMEQEVIRAFADRLRCSPLVEAVGYLGRARYAAMVPAGSAGALVEALAEPMSLTTMEFDPLVIAGVDEHHEAGVPAAQLLRHAETALEHCTEGRTAYVIHAAWMEPDPEDIELMQDFRRRQGEGLYAVYQPQISLADGRCVGCEALVRWNHVRLGYVSPARFVPLLEHTGQIAVLTKCMVEETFRMSVALRNGGLVCPISINVSAHDLLETDLDEILSEGVQRHGIDAGDVQIELTETGFAVDIDGVNEALQRVRALGIRVLIDDLGTGYASLAYLSHFSVDAVKIDRMFVYDMRTNQRHRAIVQAIIRMAHDLGLPVTAEGVEDVATLEALRAEGCDQAQGFVIAKPLEADDLWKFLRGSTSGVAPERRREVD